ncbi:MAG: LysE family translocator [Gammaproteobacteria bacterium]|nr:LysE family translocator [Gammaproteobacteria bacterium]
MLLGAMLPGADFAIVTKNSLLHSRKAGLYSAIGIVAAMGIHMTYCVLGFAVIIRQSPWLFHGIQYAGAAYLCYMGINLLKQHDRNTLNIKGEVQRKDISPEKAFRQGFICNLLNPKATLFFLTIFSAISTSHSDISLNILYAIEMLCIALFWFCTLAYGISHPIVSGWLNRSQKTIERILALILFSLAIFMVFLG